MTDNRWHAERSCDSKRYYYTEKKAWKAARCMMIDHPGQDFQTYECRYCGGFHVAHLDSTGQIMKQRAEEKRNQPKPVKGPHVCPGPERFEILYLGGMCSKEKNRLKSTYHPDKPRGRWLERLKAGQVNLPVLRKNDVV